MYQNNVTKIAKKNLALGVVLTILILIGGHTNWFIFIPRPILTVLSKNYLQLILFLPILTWVAQNMWNLVYLDLKKRQVPRDLPFASAILIGSLISVITVFMPGLFRQLNFTSKTYFGTLSLLIIIKGMADYLILEWSKKTVFDRLISDYEKNLFKLIQRINLAILTLSIVIGFGWVYGLHSPFYLEILLLLASLVIITPRILQVADSGLISQSVKKLDKLGVSIKKTDDLINLNQVHRVVFSKTGVLTTGNLKIIDLVAAKPRTLLRLAVNLEQNLDHPIALALQKRALEEKIIPEPISSQIFFPGLGVTALFKGKKIVLGNMALMKQENIVVGVLQREKKRLEKLGRKVIILGVAGSGDRTKPRPGEVIGLISLEDELRVGVKELINSLKAKGVEPWVVTGESQVSAEVMGEKLGIPTDNILPEVLPNQKSLILRELRKKIEPQQILALVGGQLTQADLWPQVDATIFLGVVPDHLENKIKIVIKNHDLRNIKYLLNNSDRVYAKLKLNRTISLAYLLVFYPLSLGLLFFNPLNFYIHPVIAIILASLASGGLLVNSTLKDN